MEVGENDDGNAYEFYGVQLGYQRHSALGEGNYRWVVTTASADFLDPTGA